MVQGLDCKLQRNIDHLFFADDLIIISNASRVAAQSISLCLSIYGDLSGQKPNPNKSTIHFPSWCNHRIMQAIKGILNMNMGKFPFKYLGALISSKRLPIKKFQFLIDNA